jgi:hypothetical protein
MSASPSNEPASLPLLGKFLFVAAFGTAGLALLAVAFGWIHPLAQSMEAPRWVLGAAGIMFLAGGFIPMTIRRGSNAWQSRLVGAVVLLALAAIFNWIAFGPGPRHFTSTITFGGSSGQRAAMGDTSGRMIFGIIAVLIDLLVIAVAVRWMRARKP